jgi:hypothetical protein
VRLCQCIPLYIGQLGLLILILIYIVNTTNAIDRVHPYFFSHGVIFRPKKQKKNKIDSHLQNKHVIFIH